MRQKKSLLSDPLSHRLDESTEDISKVPFGQLIGGVLTACIEAQSHASDVSWKYAKDLLFQGDPTEQKVASITFSYSQNNVLNCLTIPLFTVVPVPCLKLDDVDLDFEATVSVDNSNKDNFLVTIGSDRVNESVMATATAKNNLHINIKAKSGNVPTGIAQMMRLFGDNGIVVEDLPFSSGSGHRSVEDVINSINANTAIANDSQTATDSKDEGKGKGRIKNKSNSNIKGNIANILKDNDRRKGKKKKNS